MYAYVLAVSCVAPVGRRVLTCRISCHGSACQGSALLYKYSLCSSYCLGEKMSGTCCVRVRSCAGSLHTQALSLGPFQGQAGPLEAGRRAA